jgi:hypothetical protein
MLLITHILIAILGVLATTVLVVSPSKVKVRISYGFATGTLLTGTILTISNPTHLAQSCITGILYFSAIGILIAISQCTLAKQKH